MIQSYPDQLLTGELVPWYDKYLSKPNSSKYTIPTGFQSCVGNESSDVRTRALELYQLHIFKGPLIQPKAPGQGQDIPEGWNLVQSGEDVLTPLGRNSYNIGRQFNKDSTRMNIVMNLLCTVFVTSFVEKYQEEKFFLFELQNYIEDNLKKFIDDEINVRRYAAIILVSCIHSNKLDWLIKNYKKQKTLTKFLFQKRGSKQVYIKGNEVINNNVNSFVAPKKPLFWVAEPRGLYTRACNSKSNYLDSIYNLNLKRIANGEKSVANDLDRFLKEDLDLLNANGRVVKKYPELKDSWQKIYDSLSRFQKTKKNLYSVIGMSQKHISDVKLNEKKSQKKLVNESLDRLKELALRNQNKVPKEILTKGSAFVRDPYVVAYVKRKANGICDLCEKPAPFHNSSGEPYLECHHLVRLADEGEDSINNAVALCANCHRKMHILNSNKDVSILEDKIKKRDNSDPLPVT